MYVGVLLSFPSLWGPFKGILGHMFVRCIQCVANPSPYSLFYLFLYRSLSCLSPELLNADSSGPPNNQLLRHLLIKTCNFCFSPLVNLHVSALCKSTVFLFHPSHAWVSPPTPRLLTTHNWRRYLESSTFSISSLTIITRLIPLYEHNRIWPYLPHFINNLTNTFTLNCLDSSRCFLASSFVHEKYYS